jgi:transaldolase
VVSGVTTNPTLVSKEGGIDFHGRVREIAEIVRGPVSAEAVSLESERLVPEARELSEIHPDVVVKIPMCPEGLKAASQLAKEGIDTNVTLVFSANQALLAAAAGATYVSPFVGRLDDIGEDGLALISDIVEMFNIHSIDTKIIAASLRHPAHVRGAALAGADIATVPFKVLKAMFNHPLTTSGIDRFNEDWKTYLSKRGK